MAVRILALDRLPPGLHYDEAFKAVQARESLRSGQYPVFYSGNFGEEPVHIWLDALIMAGVGLRAWAVRLSSAVFGILLVPALYFAGRVLLRSRLAAVVAAFLGASLYWSLNFSRIAIEPISLALVLTLHIGTLWWALRPGSAELAASTRAVRLIAAGLFAGAVYYTYLASRVTPAALGLFGLYLVIWHRDLLRRQARGLVWAGLAGAAVVLPLAIFFFQNPVAFGARAGQVLTPESLGSNLLATAGMFFFRGDPDPRDNLPGRAALDPLLAGLFIVGLVVSVRRWRQPPYALLLIWLLVFTAPAVVTEFAPNFRRSIGALPAVILLCAAGGEALVAFLQQWVLRQSRGRRQGKPGSDVLPSARGKILDLPALPVAFLGLVLALSGLASLYSYFGIWGADPGLFYSFDAGLLQVGEQLAARPQREQLCLSPNYPDHPTVLWAMDDRSYFTFDGRRVQVLPNSALPTTCAIITFEDRQFSPSRLLSGVQPLASVLDFESRPYAEIVTIPAGAATVARPQYLKPARFGDSIQLEGYDLLRQGENLELTLYWSALGAVSQDYTVFVHLAGPTNPATGSTLWSQDDAFPGHGSYPTHRWQPGQTILDHYHLRLPGDAPPATYAIEVGVYALETGIRLPASAEGKSLEDNRLLLQTLQK